MRTDLTSPTGTFTRPVRQLSIKPLVWLAVLSTTAILACKDDPSSLGGTGRLTITVVPYEGAQAEASAVSNAESTARPSEQTSDEKRDLDVGPEKEEAKAARQTAAAPPRRDLLRVTVSGPEIRTLDFFPNADGSVDATISSLAVGSYSVELLGIDIDLGVESVSEYGINNSVTVLSDQTTDAVISFGSFLPVIDPLLPAQTSEFAFFVDYSAVPTATGYFFELDTDPSFSAPTTVSLTGTSVIVSVVAPGPNWMRVRAENNSVPAAQAKPSDPVLVDVVVDINPTGDNSATAPLLGVVRGANGQYGGYNIFPATDQDWFAVDLVAGATLSVDVLAESLASPPPNEATAVQAAAPSVLDPFVEIYDPLLTIIAFNDDIDPGIILESRVTDVPIPADGRYFIRVTSFDGLSVGHYELLIFVNATPVVTVTVAPSTATITPGGTVQLTGRTFDALGVELFGREALWTTSDINHATVDINGLVTGVSVSQAAITFSYEGVTAQATITVSSGAPDLIGSTSGGMGFNPSALYSVDRTTGSVTPIGMIGFNRVGAMDVHPMTGVVYAAAQRASDNVAVLITIDQTTGVGTEIGLTGIDGAISDLSFHSDGTLYGHFATMALHSLYTFNTGTGLATLVGFTGLGGAGNGLTFDATNSLYVTASSTLYTLSPTTGIATLQGSLTFSDATCAIKAVDRDPVSGTFFAVLGCATGEVLATLDIATRTVTSIGATATNLDGIAVPGQPPSPQWIQLAPTGTPPTGRSNVGAVIDVATNQN